MMKAILLTFAIVLLAGCASTRYVPYRVVDGGVNHSNIIEACDVAHNSNEYILTPCK